MGSQCSYHIQNISCYIWLLPLLIISSQNSITVHTSLHKRPAPEMTICSSNLISPWAAMTVNENMAYVLGHMQWIKPLICQRQQFCSGLLYLPKSPVYRIRSLWHHKHLLPQCFWCLYTSSGEFFLLVQLFSLWLHFLRYFILLSCFMWTASSFPFVFEIIHKFQKAAIHIELASFQNMSETKMQPRVVHPGFFSVSSLLENKWLWNLPSNFNLFYFCVITIIVSWLFTF